MFLLSHVWFSLPWIHILGHVMALRTLLNGNGLHLDISLLKDVH